ncbi:MAG: hypothetical protein M5U26_23215 [Planctomycetota bacterium]|nr:hypothetical protein [Planctomycetota bacterium]
MDEQYNCPEQLSTNSNPVEATLDGIRHFRIRNPLCRIVFIARGSADPFRYTIGQWGCLLKLALRYGWIPEGAQSLNRRADLYHPERDDFHGYMMKAYRVRRSDAKSLSQALRRSLPDLPSQSTEHDRELNLCEMFAGGHKEKLQDFIRFTNRGGFNLW